MEIESIQLFVETGTTVCNRQKQQFRTS